MKKYIFKKHKKRSNFIVPFCITLALITFTGCFVMFSYAWITEDVGSMSGKSAVVPIEEKLINTDIITEVTYGENGSENGQNAVDKEYEDDRRPAAGEEYALSENVFERGAADKDTVTIAFTGDILFDPNYAVMASLISRGGNIEDAVSPELIDEMKSADIMMVNNEFPYSDRGAPLPEKQFTFRAKPSYVSYLNEMGVDIVSLANNHAYDYGEEAFLDTLQVLKDADIHYVGAGVNAAEAIRPVYFVINDMKIAFVSATQIERNDVPDTKEATENTPGVFRCWNGEKLMQVVKEAKENSDFVIVYVHWGTENQEETDWAQDTQSVELTGAGADLIVGDHPHIVQKVDIINGVPVFFSMGNFLFNSKTLDTGLLKVTLSEGGLKSCQFIPCLQSGCKTKMLDGAEKERALEAMRKMSQNVNIDSDGFLEID